MKTIETGLTVFEVYQQYTPTKVVDTEMTKEGKPEKIYAPAVFLRGTILAVDGSDAIDKAIQTGMASRPMVRAA